MNYFELLSESLHAISVDDLRRVVDGIRNTASKQGIVWVFGNGGSFANAQHWVCDLQKFALVRSMALGSNGSLLTALSNDIQYDNAVAEEFSAVSGYGDILIVLSCSGCSPNITRLLMRSRDLLIPSILVTGSLNTIVAQADAVIRVNSDEYGIIEDCHSAIGHWLANELHKSNNR